MEGNKVFAFLLLIPLLIGAGCSKVGNLANGPKECGSDLKCFEEQFKKCKPAKRLARVNDEIEFRYEILGPKNGSCEVKQGYTDSPLPLLIGLDGFCMYDNSKSFADASAEIIGSGTNLPNYCQGPLIDELYKMANYNSSGK